MTAKKITDFADGGAFQSGDSILIARGSDNFYMNGGIIANAITRITTLESNAGSGSGGGGEATTGGFTRAPLASQFTHSTFGRAATKPMIISDVPLFGMRLYSDGTMGDGYSGATREIPTDMRGAFTFIAKIKGSSIFRQNAGPGVIMATGDGAGSGIKTQYLGCQNGIAGNGQGPYGGWNDNGSYSDVNFQKLGSFEWFKTVITGTSCEFFIGDDGLNWISQAVRNFGTPITRYGFSLYHSADSKPVGFTVRHFESTEFPDVIFGAGLN